MVVERAILHTGSVSAELNEIRGLHCQSTLMALTSLGERAANLDVALTDSTVETYMTLRHFQKAV